MQKILITLLFLVSAVAQSQIAHKRKLFLLGSPFELTVVAQDTLQGNIFIDQGIAEVKRIENLISDWIPTTLISEINRNAGIRPIKVTTELYDLVERSIKISELTSGAFDISYASMDRIWKFDGSMKSMPTEEAIKNSVAKIGYKKIILNPKESTVFLQDAGMKVGLGGIGQGYIADKVYELLLSKGCQSGLINVSGDIKAWGKQPNGEAWTVGIINPVNKNKVFATFPLDNSAVETSGNYEKYVTFNGKRYSHIIDPRTGYPATGLVSVSVFAKQTEVADALATGVFVLGVDVGLNLINQLKGIGCIIVDDQGKVHASNNIDIKKYQK
jgi:thiamine biosynthesis lipoprotein